MFDKCEKDYNDTSVIVESEGCHSYEGGWCDLESGLKLENVLFVSQLTYNLISISKLIDAFNCIVQFTNALCVIQDCQDMELIFFYLSARTHILIGGN